jgi:glutamyl-tRNA reductase
MHDRELVVVGLDHTTAPIGLRERVAFADADIPAALARLGRGPLEQAAILSTCNRVELYGVARPGLPADGLATLLAPDDRVDRGALVGSLYVHRDDAVPHHLAATAAGMHSLVLGETQIQGQVRTALQHALAAGTAGPELRRLFESAIAAGRRVRSRTRLCRGVAGVPQASVELAHRRLGTLAGTTVLLIGGGRVTELAAAELSVRGVRELLVLGRGATRAERIAALALADLVISATSTPGAVVHADDLAARGGAPLLLIDLAVPRDVDPAVAQVRGVELHTLDDLQALIDGTLLQRRTELPAAHAVLRSEVTRFTTWLGRREPAPA